MCVYTQRHLTRGAGIQRVASDTSAPNMNSSNAPDQGAVVLGYILDVGGLKKIPIYPNFDAPPPHSRLRPLVNCGCPYPARKDTAGSESECLSGGGRNTFQVKIDYVLRCWHEKHVNTAEECGRRTNRVQHLLQNMSPHARQWWRRRKRKNDLLQDRQRGASASGIHTTSACCV